MVHYPKVQSTIKGDNKYNLCLSQSNSLNYVKINAKSESNNFLIENRNIYYCCFSFIENRIYTFLYCELLKRNNDVFNNVNLITEIKGESDYIFTIGNDNGNSSSALLFSFPIWKEKNKADLFISVFSNLIDIIEFL